jgi:hypothetical protein
VANRTCTLCDALADNQSAIAVREDEKLRVIATEL